MNNMNAHIPNRVLPPPPQASTALPNEAITPAMGNTNTPFQIVEGQLDTQAADYIATADTNRDGAVGFNEMIDAGGLTGQVSTYMSKDQAYAFWASIAGPDGTLSVREYAQTLVGIDENRNGQITQEESDRVKLGVAEDALKDPGVANVDHYNRFTAVGSEIGLDKVFPLGEEAEQSYALADANAAKTEQTSIDLSKSANTAKTESQAYINEVTQAEGLDPIHIPEASYESASPLAQALMGVMTHYLESMMPKTPDSQTYADSSASKPEYTKTEAPYTEQKTYATQKAPSYMPEKTVAKQEEPSYVQPGMKTEKTQASYAPMEEMQQMLLPMLLIMVMFMGFGQQAYQA